MRTRLKDPWLLDGHYNMEKSNVLIDGSRIASVSSRDMEADRIVILDGYTLMPGWVDVDLPLMGTDVVKSAMEHSAQFGSASVRICLSSDADIPAATPPELRYSCLYEDRIPYSEDRQLSLRDRGYGGITIPGHAVQNMDTETLQKICRKAEQMGLWVISRAATAEILQNLTFCGITELLDTPRFPMDETQITVMVAKGICMGCSTENVLEADPVSMDNLRRFYLSGGVITMGSGRGTACSFGQRMEYLLKVGLPLHKAVQTASLWGALVLGMPGEYGSISAGKFANLSVVHGDPRENPEILYHVETLARNGVLCQQSFVQGV